MLFCLFGKRGLEINVFQLQLRIFQPGNVAVQQCLKLAPLADSRFKLFIGLEKQTISIANFSFVLLET